MTNLRPPEKKTFEFTVGVFHMAKTGARVASDKSEEYSACAEKTHPRVFGRWIFLPTFLKDRLLATNTQNAVISLCFGREAVRSESGESSAGPAAPPPLGRGIHAGAAPLQWPRLSKPRPHRRKQPRTSQTSPPARRPPPPPLLALGTKRDSRRAEAGPAAASLRGRLSVVCVVWWTRHAVCVPAAQGRLPTTARGSQGGGAHKQRGPQVGRGVVGRSH